MKSIKIDSIIQWYSENKKYFAAQKSTWYSSAFIGISTFVIKM